MQLNCRSISIKLSLPISTVNKRDVPRKTRAESEQRVAHHKKQYSPSRFLPLKGAREHLHRNYRVELVSRWVLKGALTPAPPCSRLTSSRAPQEQKTLFLTKSFVVSVRFSLGDFVAASSPLCRRDPPIRAQKSLHCGSLSGR
jgi:hypothetical protein